MTFRCPYAPPEPEEAPIPDISVVVPVYREEKNIPPFIERMKGVLDGLGISWEMLFCLDPSPDRTEEVIVEAANADERIKLLVFSRRFGQPAATMSGILACRGACCVVIDVDLQDPPELIAEMYAKYKEGFDVVYAQRRSRQGETIPKKIISYLGYAVINKLSHVEIPRNTGDFRIISRRVIEELRGLKETHGFLRGLVAFVGFPQACVQYDRDPRLFGKGNYNRITGSLRIGLNGIVAFSSRPLFVMSVFGFIIAMFSFLLGAWYVVQKFILNLNMTPGLPTTVLAISFFSGVNMLCLGLLGEYVGRIYDEVKGRPISIVKRRINMGGDSERRCPGEQRNR